MDPDDEALEEMNETLRRENSLYAGDFEERCLATQEISYFEVFMQFLRQIKPGVPLYRTSSPAILLSPVSGLEKASFGITPNMALLGISHQTDPEVRFVQMLQWKLSTMKTLPRVGVKGSKPYNPILREFFRCLWVSPHDGAESLYLAEQVSHHPPITAYVMSAPERGGLLSIGTFQPGIKLHVNSLAINITGISAVSLTDFDEEYTFSYPTCYVANLWWGGATGTTIHGRMTLNCERTGYSAQLDFVYKGNDYSGWIKDPNGNKIYEITGDIIGSSTIRSLRNKRDPAPALVLGQIFERGPGVRDQGVDTDEILQSLGVPTRPQVFIDHARMESERRHIRCLDEMELTESRRVWHSVSKRIMEDDFPEANQIKYEIEESQRVLSRARQSEGREILPRFFFFNEDRGGYWPRDDVVANIRRIVKETAEDFE